MGLLRGAAIHEINLQNSTRATADPSFGVEWQAQRAVLVLLNCSFLWVTIELAGKKNEIDALKRFAANAQLYVNV